VCTGCHTTPAVHFCRRKDWALPECAACASSEGEEACAEVMLCASCFKGIGCSKCLEFECEHCQHVDDMGMEVYDMYSSDCALKCRPCHFCGEQICVSCSMRCEKCNHTKKKRLRKKIYISVCFFLSTINCKMDS